MSVLFSVIVPVFNCENYIKDSIFSVIEQDFKNLEIIIINDGSTDGTYDEIQKIIKKLSEKSIKYIFISRDFNIGCFKTRTEAIKISEGKYIAINDADDINFPYRFEDEIKFLENNPEIWCVGGHALKIDEQNKEIETMNYPPEKNDDIISMITKKCMNPIIDSTAIFRKKDFESLNGYSLKEEINLVDDFNLWCKSILNGKKFYNFQKLLIKYRINPEGNTLKYKEKMIKQHMIVWNQFIEENKGKK